MKHAKYLLLLLFLFRAKTGMTQLVQQMHFAGQVKVGNWNRSFPLADFLKIAGKKGDLIVIGYSRKSVFSYEVTYKDDHADSLKQGEIIETDTNGHRKKWSAADVFGYDIINDHRSDSILKKSQPKVNLHLEETLPVDLWICSSEYSWVAKANSEKLKKCFTWYYEGGSYDTRTKKHLAAFSVKAGAYNYSRELKIFGTSFTVPVSYTVDTVSAKQMRMISGKDTISIVWKDIVDSRDSLPRWPDMDFDTLSPIPYRWLTALSPGNDEKALVDAQYEMNHPDSSLKKRFPEIKTHKAQYLVNKIQLTSSKEFYNVSMILLTPLNQQKGRVYVILPYDCYKGVNFVIIETSIADAAAQKRFIKIFKSIRN